MEWLIPLFFWIIGLLIISGGEYINKKMGQKKDQMIRHAESARAFDTDESVYFALEGKALDAIPWFVVRLFTVIIGMIVIVLGFVALSLIL
jgi:hypothetical protein